MLKHQKGMPPMSATVIREFEEIKLEKEDGIAVLTLYRPEKMNAFTGRMMQELVTAFDETDKDDAVPLGRRRRSNRRHLRAACCDP